MIKVKITPQRFAEATRILEYLSVTNGNRDAAARLIPRFILNGDDDYIVKVTLDEDGDITDFENMPAAVEKLNVITGARADKLAGEIIKAARDIVNPPSGRD